MHKRIAADMLERAHDFAERLQTPVYVMQSRGFELAILSESTRVEVGVPPGWEIIETIQPKEEKPKIN